MHKKKYFYGWVILAQSFLLFFVNGGGVFHAFGVFFPEMVADLGWSRGVGAISFSLMIIVVGIMSVPVGFLISKIGIRKVMAAGNIIMVSALLLMSTVTEVWHMYLAYGILAGIGVVASGYIPVITMANNWFIKKRALAIGVCMAGFGVGTFVLAPVNRHLIDSIGWRNAWLVIAAIDFFVGLLPAVIFARTRPEDMGQMPDGAVITQKELDKTISDEVSILSADWDIKEALKTPALWLITVMMSASFFTGTMLSTHQVIYLQDIGITPMVAAGAIGLLIGISTLGRVSGGALGDRINPRHLAAIASGLQAVAIIILLNAKTLGLIYFYVIIFGLSYGMVTVLYPTIIGVYFGRKNYGTIFGLSNTIVQLIGATSATFAGFVFDITGSYFIPFTTAIFFCVIGVVCVLIARPPKSLQQNIV